MLLRMSGFSQLLMRACSKNTPRLIRRLNMLSPMVFNPLPLPTLLSRFLFGEQSASAIKFGERDVDSNLDRLSLRITPGFEYQQQPVRFGGNFARVLDWGSASSDIQIVEPGLLSLANESHTEALLFSMPTINLP